MRVAGLVVLLAACGGSAAPPAIDNTGAAPAPASPRHDGSLSGPHRSLADSPFALADDEDPDPSPGAFHPHHQVLARTTGAVSVALVERVDSQAASTCAAVIEAPEGVYVGADFLCRALRSDEEVEIDEVSATIEGGAAWLRFRVSYRLLPGAPAVERHQVRCSLDAPRSCSPPPAIGGYE